ncbi:MAG: tRNA 2-thiouridine(34) synthase MnmA [Deltaproteobacteria bacterium]|nr:tRNA 2-thiouridine(34) synthase MnmA [Deltaproteobacteria bacterium]
MIAKAPIVVALSGGVDSSVAALLLQRQGYELLAVTLQLQNCHDSAESRSCCGIDGVVRARAAASRLGIRHYVLDSVDAFERAVLVPTWAEYDRGRTPSPCLHCNEQIKFGTLLEWAKGLGAQAVATGHYARILKDASGQPSLWRGVDAGKDQSYFLAGLTAQQLALTRFPLGGLTKEEVRKIALEAELPTAEERESQDACLVGAGEAFAEMLRRRFDGKAREGAVVDEEGRELGHHPGVHHFTIGQRRGLGIQSLERTWVTSIDHQSSEVVVTRQPDDLLRKDLRALGMVWTAGSPPDVDSEGPWRCLAQIRSQHRAASAEFRVISPEEVEVVFDDPVRAIAPGQALVLYQGERVIGRGWIDTSRKMAATDEKA